MAIAIIDGYLVKGSSNPTLIITVDITGKFFLFSVMINLCGRNLVQESFNLAMSPQPRSLPSRNYDGAATNAISVEIQREKFTEYELNEWPFAPKSPGICLGHKQSESRSDNTETEIYSNELTMCTHTEHTKPPEIIISVDEDSFKKQGLGHQV
ncbi:hypothetical protein RSOLAG1IB_01621 [Rhizoctonia solani AG-1 IB]|uniref:Uncharacterized protein n=1 Tax=Thanatephorus cucumeris (strain AG1-IB / isolate 7/3/14) TaxID=1108050 RepID=A0A0B7FFG0_THACB|nr:hypothetical protein RSOLAG1IB_01621 [Rhizoctonia solani AG-1 IB]